MTDTAPAMNTTLPVWTNIYVDGLVRLSLRTVLDILGLRVIYSETKLRFIDLETNEEKFQFPRHPDGIRTPWDALRKRKMLDREKFERRAQAFLEANPRYTA
jgi:hypothetical protein